MSRNIDILEHILKYCDDINSDIDYFGNTFDKFLELPRYQRSISFSLLQIGELAKKLTDNYIQITCDEMNWKAIKGLRNLIVHDYGNISLDIIWQTITQDIPQLSNFCRKKVDEAENIMMESKKYVDDKFIDDYKENNMTLKKLDLN